MFRIALEKAPMSISFRVRSILKMIIATMRARYLIIL